MKRVILDTNALMAIAEFKIDIFSELVGYSVVTLSGVVEELQKIHDQQRGKFKRAAKLALEILYSKKVKIIVSSGNVDDALVELSKNNLVLTQDIALKKRLSKPYMTIRQKKKVVVVE
tara:strand:- start:7422 stop:7775 length:354 start_codon:yes stop_codon:yes gene_type:complete